MLARPWALTKEIEQPAVRTASAAEATLDMITEGLARPVALVLLRTKLVPTRPWELLKRLYSQVGTYAPLGIDEALLRKRHRIPITPLRTEGPGHDYFETHDRQRRAVPAGRSHGVDRTTSFPDASDAMSHMRYSQKALPDLVHWYYRERSWCLRAPGHDEALVVKVGAYAPLGGDGAPLSIATPYPCCTLAHRRPWLRLVRGSGPAVTRGTRR